MSRFDVYRNDGGNGYLLDVQSDLLGGLNTRVVVPLLAENDAPVPAERLNPVFAVENTTVIMATQFMAAVPEAELKMFICDLSGAHQDVSAALDMLFLGF